MPSSSVSEESLLLTANGWLRAGSAQSAVDCFGIDRHGRVVPSRVQVTHTNARSREAFIGTAAAFASFVGETHLLASDGRIVRMGSVVEKGEIGDLSFETLFRLPDSHPVVFGISETWMAFVGQAAFSKGKKIALRCYERHVETERFPRTVNDGTLSYCLMDRDDLEPRLIANGCETICQLGMRWLHNTTEARDEIERSATHFLSHYLTARHYSGKWYRLTYDSLQHTVYVCVSDEPNQPPPIDKGSCALFGPGEPAVVTLSWEGNSWSLLSGGFLVAGS